MKPYELRALRAAIDALETELRATRPDGRLSRGAHVALAAARIILARVERAHERKESPCPASTT